MHIAEGILPMAHAAPWTLAAAPFVIESARRCKQLIETGGTDKRALLTLSFAFVFAATIFPVPVPFAGLSSHMCFTALTGIVLGPWLTILPVALVLLIQALFFAHGGISTLGANLFSLGILAPFFGYTLGRFAFRLAPSFLAIGIVAALSDLLVYAADALILSLAFVSSGSEKSFSEWCRIILMGFAPAQIPLAILEGVLTTLLLRIILSRRQELLPEWITSKIKRHHGSFTPAIITSGIILIISDNLALAADFKGIDELVIEKTALQAGRSLMPPLINLDQGDLGLFVFCLGGFVSGFFTGSHWRQLFGIDAAKNKKQAPHAP